MQPVKKDPVIPQLKELVAEASQALARLDAARLEELAVSCQTLTQMLGPKEAHVRGLLASQARDMQSDIAVFARVIEATRANLNVMNRLRELGAGSVEYTEGQVRCGRGSVSSLKVSLENPLQATPRAEERYGND